MRRSDNDAKRSSGYFTAMVGWFAPPLTLSSRDNRMFERAIRKNGQAWLVEEEFSREPMTVCVIDQIGMALRDRFGPVVDAPMPRLFHELSHRIEMAAA